MRSTLESVWMKAAVRLRWSSLSVMPGTSTWRIQTGLPIFERYLSPLRMLAFPSLTFSTKLL